MDVAEGDALSCSLASKTGKRGATSGSQADSLHTSPRDCITTSAVPKVRKRVQGSSETLDLYRLWRPSEAVMSSEEIRLQGALSSELAERRVVPSSCARASPASSRAAWRCTSAGQPPCTVSAGHRRHTTPSCTQHHVRLLLTQGTVSFMCEHVSVWE